LDEEVPAEKGAGAGAGAGCWVLEAMGGMSKEAWRENAGAAASSSSGYAADREAAQTLARKPKAAQAEKERGQRLSTPTSKTIPRCFTIADSVQVQ
jgi:hypothetical protein